MKFCLCGCGGIVKPKRLFISGHNSRVKEYSHNRIYEKLTEKQKLKLSEAHKGRSFSESHKNKISNSLKGKLFSDSHKLNLSKSHKGKKLSESHKNKLRIKSTGVNNPFFNRRHTKSTKIKISNKLKILLSNKENHPNWKGGTSFEPYSPDWDETLKSKIKTRDNNECQNHNCKSIKIIQLHVHHIDYNKKNCSESNLITLCVSCHSKTNYNRKYWEKFYSDIINRRNNHGIIHRSSASRLVTINRKQRVEKNVSVKTQLGY